MIGGAGWLAFLVLNAVLLISISAGTANARKKGLGELYPSARVGRSDPSMPPNCCRGYYKRHQGLIPFPRVGRSGGWQLGGLDDNKLLALLAPFSMRFEKNDRILTEEDDKDSRALPENTGGGDEDGVSIERENRLGSW